MRLRNTFLFASTLLLLHLPSLSQNATATPKHREPLGDYVPCIFGRDTTYDMRDIPNPLTVGPTDQQTLDLGTSAKVLANVEYSIEKFGHDQNINVESLRDDFIKSLQPSALAGKTPSDAYSMIDRTLRANNAAIPTYYYRIKPSTKNTKNKDKENKEDKGNEEDNPTPKYPKPATEIIERLSPAAINAAIRAVNDTRAYQAPDDISCSISIMSWQETNDVFGRRVANQFVALQVNVRNLNPKNEFLIHDIQVAVDTGVTPDYFGRFQAGRDKLLVRAVAQRGASEDRRNLTLNALQSLGSIAGASSITAGTIQFKDAIAVFQGAFLQGYANVFPDHTIEQLNHISDLVFSASNTSKVIVPIQGSVPLVTFIAAKPIEELPFAWCGHTEQKPDDLTDNFTTRGWLHSRLGKRTGHCYFDNTLPDNGYAYNNDLHYNSAEPWDDLPYKKWKPAALRMLQNQTYVVVGGVHIQEVRQQPKIAAAPVCPTLSNGAIDISDTKDGVVNCTLSGNSLNLVRSVLLKKGDSEIPGTIKPATDGASANLQFKPADLSSNQGAYSLHLIYNSTSQNESVDVDTGDLVSLLKQPIITSVDTFDISKITPSTPATLTLAGTNMDQVSSVSVIPDTTEPATPSTPTDTSGTTELAKSSTAKDTSDTSTTFTFIPSNLPSTPLDPKKKYHLAYGIKVDPTKQVSRTDLSVTVKAN